MHQPNTAAVSYWFDFRRKKLNAIIRLAESYNGA